MGSATYDQPDIVMPTRSEHEMPLVIAGQDAIRRSRCVSGQDRGKVWEARSCPQSKCPAARFLSVDNELRSPLTAFDMCWKATCEKPETGWTASDA
jgi:hypothetical protein